MSSGYGFSRWDRVEIEWEDSHQVHGWVTIENAGVEEEHSLDQRSIGYFLSETDRQIVTCAHGKADAGLIESDETNVCGVFTTPKAAIKSIRRLIPARDSTPPELTDSTPKDNTPND